MSFNGNGGGGGGGDEGFIPPSIAPYYVNGWERSDHGNFYVEYTAAAQDVECRVRIATLQDLVDRQFRLMALAGDPREHPEWYEQEPAIEHESHRDLEAAARRLVDLLERVSPDEAVAQLRNRELFDADAQYPEWIDQLPTPEQDTDEWRDRPGWPHRVNGWEREWADSSTARYSAVLGDEAIAVEQGAYISVSIVQQHTSGREQYVLRWEYALDGPMGEPTDAADSPAFDTFDQAAQRFKQTLERFTPGVFLGDIREGDPPWGEADVSAGGRDPSAGVAGFPGEVNGWDLSVENNHPEYRAYDADGEMFARIGALVRTEADGTEEYQVFYQHSETASGDIEDGRSAWLATSDEARELILDMVASWTPGEFTNVARRGDPFEELPGWDNIAQSDTRTGTGTGTGIGAGTPPENPEQVGPWIRDQPGRGRAPIYYGDTDEFRVYLELTRPDPTGPLGIEIEVYDTQGELVAEDVDYAPEDDLDVAYDYYFDTLRAVYPETYIDDLGVTAESRVGATESGDAVDAVDVPDAIGAWQLRTDMADEAEIRRWPTYLYYPRQEDTTVRLITLEFRGALDTSSGWGVVAHIHDSPPGQVGDDRTDFVYQIPERTHAEALELFVEFVRANSPRDILHNYDTDSGYDYRLGPGGR